MRGALSRAEPSCSLAYFEKSVPLVAYPTLTYWAKALAYWKFTATRRHNRSLIRALQVHAFSIINRRSVFRDLPTVDRGITKASL